MNSKLLMIDICLCNYYRGWFSVWVVVFLGYFDTLTHRVWHYFPRLQMKKQDEKEETHPSGKPPLRNLPKFKLLLLHTATSWSNSTGSENLGFHKVLRITCLLWPSGTGLLILLLSLQSTLAPYCLSAKVVPCKGRRLHLLEPTAGNKVPFSQPTRPSPMPPTPPPLSTRATHLLCEHTGTHLSRAEGSPFQVEWFYYRQEVIVEWP